MCGREHQVHHGPYAPCLLLSETRGENAFNTQLNHIIKQFIFLSHLINVIEIIISIIQLKETASITTYIDDQYITFRNHVSFSLEYCMLYKVRVVVINKFDSLLTST